MFPHVFLETGQRVVVMFGPYKVRLSLLFLLLLLSGYQALSADVVVDNDFGAPEYVETGHWITSGSTGYSGGAYRYTGGVQGAPTSSATWTPNLPSHRRYQVYAAYRQGANRATNAPLKITHSTGTTIVYLNQNGPDRIVEKLLGEFLFDEGSSGSVRMDNNGTTAVLIADAMIWRIPFDPPAEISMAGRDPDVVSQPVPVVVTAMITDNDRVSSAALCFRVSPSGISGIVRAFDDGSHGDAVAGDSVYGATIPRQPYGSIVAYHFMATDNLGQLSEGVTQYYAVEPLPPYLPDVVVDNDDGAPGYIETGRWITSSSVGYEGGTYRYAFGSPGVPTSTATWTPNLPRGGVYRVYAAFAKGDNRPNNAPVTIVHSEGQAIVSLDQTGGGIAEVLLGEYPFDAGTSGSVHLDNSGGEGAYIADAMIWHIPSDPPPVISRVTRNPIIPDSSESVLVTARITDNVAVTTASLSYTINSGTPLEVQAFDDGAHGDGEAGDDLYGAAIPPHPDGTTVILHYSARDNLGQLTESPVQRYIVGREARNVYIIISSDTSVWGVTGGYYGVLNWNVFESRTGVLSQVYDHSFRHSHVDSLGRPFKITWFMHGGAWFRTGVNSTPMSATYHIRKNWGDDIEEWGDALEYHFHHYVWNGTKWEMAPTFAETIWEYEWLMSQMMLDEHLFITSFRSGWNYMDDTYQQYLERWVPFRMEGKQSGWVPYHPSFDDYRVPGTMKGWEVRHHYTKSVSPGIANGIFKAADQGVDQVVCIWSHQNEADYPQQITDVDRVLHEAHANYPSVQFHYCSAKEAMQSWLNHTESVAPPLEVQPVIKGNIVDVTIQTADDIYQEQPWIAARRYAGDCVRLDSTKITSGTWQFNYSRKEFDHVAVGVSDIYGNDIIADVDDGSHRWAVQSEFARAQSRLVDFDTSPTCAMLQYIADSYVTTGTLTFDHRKETSGTWQSITLEGNTPAATGLKFRYKTAGARDLLDEASWSEYHADLNLALPPGLRQSWIRIEVFLKGNTSSTPGLRSVEVHYECPLPQHKGMMWSFR